MFLMLFFLLFEDGFFFLLDVGNGVCVVGDFLGFVMMLLDVLDFVIFIRGGLIKFCCIFWNFKVDFVSIVLIVFL